MKPPFEMLVALVNKDMAVIELRHIPPTTREAVKHEYATISEILEDWLLVQVTDATARKKRMPGSPIPEKRSSFYFTRSCAPLGFVADLSD